MFPSQERVAVSGFLFLRYIVPAIVSPGVLWRAWLSGLVSSRCAADLFGLVSEVKPKARRTLLLVSKLVQNLANGTRFGTKESFLVAANPWLDTWSPRLNGFIEDLTVRLCGVEDEE